MLFLAIPCPLRNLKGALRKLRPRHSPENNLRKPLRFCRGSDPNAERLERFIWRGFYYRVSTGKQDIEMPAQRAAVEAFLNGGGWKIIGEEVEVETGTKTDAPAAEACQGPGDRKETQSHAGDCQARSARARHPFHHRPAEIRCLVFVLR